MVRRVQDGMTRVEPAFEFDEIDTSTNPTTGTVLAQGFCLMSGASAGTAPVTDVPGHLGLPSALADAAQWFGFFGGSPAWGSFSGKGIRLRVKGRVVATTGTRLDASFEKFGIGFTWSTNIGATLTGIFANNTGTARDDIITVAAIVDNSNNIQSYNNVVGDGAAYTDSGFDANLVAGAEFLLQVDVPSASNSIDDLRITIQFEDNGGTLRTILNAVTPASVGTSGGTIPLGVLNVAGLVMNAFFEVTAL